ncbi:MAG: CHAT domain-containing protein, partial [Treponema sp.]|nr:CHAT domain-containing protein [Treponema sp.]
TPKKAFEYSESLRSRGFLDQLGTETALKLDGISEEEKTQVQELTAKITSSRKIIEAQNNKTLDERDEKLLSQAGTELTNAEKSLLKINEKIGKRIPAYAQLRNPKPVSVNEAQKWCGKKRTVLEYVLWNPELTDKKDVKIKSYCIVLSNKKVNVVELDGDYDYTAAINKLRKGITDLKRESQFETVRNELYEKLISPVLPHISGGTKELVVVPDGNLSFLPFDILRKDGDSKCLGDKYAVALSPSVSVSVLSGKKKASEKKMLAFGGAWYDTKLSADGHRANFTEEGISRGAKRGTYQVGFDAGDINEKLFSYMKNDIAQNGPKSYFAEKKLVWQDLPGTITELNALKDGIFKAGMFSEITQETASEKKVKELSKEGELLKFPILHFACHGYFDSRIAEMSSVLFSEVSGAAETDSEEDGYLTISETAVLNLNADLVCLSACETGLGEMKAGDGMVGLTRAFMVAGAEQVGASLWCVDDEATAKFMSGMYEKVVKKGLDYVTAYQKTKAEFRRDKDFSHPYYWSAFVLYE